jgi:hypothetical protein
VLLWLAEGTVIPPVLKQLEQNGLDIRFCTGIRSYKKLIPALTEFPDDVLITADDDAYYPKHWLRGLKNAYMNDTSKIYCYRAHEIAMGGNGDIAPYTAWRHCVKTAAHPERLFPTGAGGILYPPHALAAQCVREADFMTLAPDGDDIWFWAMAKLAGTKHEVVRKDALTRFITIDPEEALKGLWLENVHNGGNDRQIRALLERFPDITERLS